MKILNDLYSTVSQTNEQKSERLKDYTNLETKLIDLIKSVDSNFTPSLNRSQKSQSLSFLINKLITIIGESKNGDNCLNGEALSLLMKELKDFDELYRDKLFNTVRAMVSNYLKILAF